MATSPKKEIDTDFKDKIAMKARKLLVASQIYKQPRMNVLSVYELLLNNVTPPKLRQMFNVPIPIFSGMIDALLSQFNDQIQIRFKETNQAQNLVVPKIQAHWEAERDSMESNAMWNYKMRVDRSNAVLSGRGILQIYAYNEPKYTSVLNPIYYGDFHCDPLGGGILENHDFCGTENNFKSLSELKNDPKYDKDQVEKLSKFSFSNESVKNLNTTYGTKFARWKALGLDPVSNNASSETQFNLCDFIVTAEDGERYNVVFEPCSGLWLCVRRWKDVYPSGKYPYKSWATHEDDKNFWSKGYADDLYPIADAVITLFNQELTNREKKNFNARAYDKDMFKDVAKLDAAQFRPDALVPADTMGGTKRIDAGIYAFQTPELQGTINLVQWISDYTSQKLGTEETPPAPANKKVTVFLAQTQKQSKRIGYHSDSFKECYAQVGMTYLEGLREFMPSTVSIQIIGENGFVEETELKRIDVKNSGQIGIAVISTSEQEASDAMKKDGQIKAVEMVTQNPNLSRYEKELIYRNVGQFDEDEISLLLDTKGELSKKQLAHASQNIQDILLGKEPEIYYGADLSYMTYLNSYITDNKGKLRGKEMQFMQFLNTMGQIVNENAMRQAEKTQPSIQGQPQDQQPPQEMPTPSGGSPTPQSIVARASKVPA